MFQITGFGVHTLKDIDLTVKSGQSVGLTGPSGSGKSLLLRAMADLDPHQGVMSLDGVEADQIPAPQWRRQVGLLPAETAWWHDTVGPHFNQVPVAWLMEVGFDISVMDWKISRLSSGERQRLALVRLLAMQPRVLLLDEPTANLDRMNSRRVESLLGDYRRSHDVMIIWVGHDPEQLERNCNPVYMVEHNALVCLDARAHDDIRVEP